MENQNKHLFKTQDKGLEIGQTADNKEIVIIGKSLSRINSIREFPLDIDDTLEWASIIKLTIPDVNPIEIEEAIIDISSGKFEYNISEGARCIILAIQKNRGNNWYYDPNK